MINIYIPKNIKFIILNNSFLYLYNNELFLLLNINKYNFYYNTLLNILKINTNLKLLSKRNFLNNFLFLWNNFLFNKLYFLGKGFKLKKINNNTYFNFNHSHIKLMINQKSIIKKIQKNKLLIINKDFNVLKNLTNISNNIKKLSFYTKRGMRSAKQIVYIKKNKSSAK